MPERLFFLSLDENRLKCIRLYTSTLGAFLLSFVLGVETTLLSLPPLPGLLFDLVIEPVVYATALVLGDFKRASSWASVVGTCIFALLLKIILALLVDTGN